MRVHDTTLSGAGSSKVGKSLRAVKGVYEETRANVEAKGTPIRDTNPKFTICGNAVNGHFFESDLSYDAGQLGCVGDKRAALTLAPEKSDLPYSPPVGQL